MKTKNQPVMAPIGARSLLFINFLVMILSITFIVYGLHIQDAGFVIQGGIIALCITGVTVYILRHWVAVKDR